MWELLSFFIILHIFCLCDEHYSDFNYLRYSPALKKKRKLAFWVIYPICSMSYCLSCLYYSLRTEVKMCSTSCLIYSASQIFTSLVWVLWRVCGFLLFVCTCETANWAFFVWMIWIDAELDKKQEWREWPFCLSKPYRLIMFIPFHQTINCFS